MEKTLTLYNESFLGTVSHVLKLKLKKRAETTPPDTSQSGHISRARDLLEPPLWLL